MDWGREDNLEKLYFTEILHSQYKKKDVKGQIGNNKIVKIKNIISKIKLK